MSAGWSRGGRRPGLLAVLAGCIFLLVGLLPAAADGFRSITTVTGDYYFPGASTAQSYYVETEEVFLVRLNRVLTLEAKVTRDDFIGGPQHIFHLGPVVSFADTVYAVAVYGLGLDAAGNLIHEADASFDWETDTSAAFLNFKGDYFTSNGSWYVIPSIGGKFHLLPALGMFGEYFMSWDSAGQITGAFWGQADYALSEVVSLLAGFTVSFSRNLGWSVIAGATFNITKNISLKYTASFLSNSVEYQNQLVATTSTGVENLLSLDWKF